MNAKPGSLLFEVPKNKSLDKRHTRRILCHIQFRLMEKPTRKKQYLHKDQRVAAANSITGNWQEFLRVDENKTELFNFLAHEVVENMSTEKEVFSTCGKHVLCSRRGGYAQVPAR